MAKSEASFMEGFSNEGKLYDTASSHTQSLAPPGSEPWKHSADVSAGANFLKPLGFKSFHYFLSQCSEASKILK